MNQIQVNSRSSLHTHFNNLLQIGKRPIEWLRYTFVPSNNLSDSLRRINEAAHEGIQKAKNNGIKIHSTFAQINNELDQALNQRLVRQDEHNQVDTTDWKQRQLELQKKIVEKTSVFATLIQMRNRAGIVEANNLKILALVKQATEGPNPISVWKVFVNNYELGFFQKLFAAFFYWFFYKTSLISTTIEAYLTVFIESITKDLTIQSNETRTKVFRAFIKNTHSFLLEDLKATKDFANEKVSGLLEEVRDRAIEKNYGFSLKTLCENFSKVFDEEDPQVPFFHDLQSIPFIGWAFKIFEWMVNKLIIQRTMKTSILPTVLEQIVRNGIEATQPDKLPFVISLTQFFTSQLEKLQKTLDTEPFPPSKSTGTVTGTELLPPTIKLLIQALELEGEYTPQELRKKIADYEKEKTGFFKLLGFFDTQIVSKIEHSVIEAGNTLFCYLNETIQSGELFTRLLDLSLAPFGAEENTEEILKSQYEEEIAKFEATASAVFKNLIRKSVSGSSNELSTQQLVELAQNTLDNQAIIANKLFEKMNTVCSRMEQKVKASEENIFNKKNIEEDFVELLQLMQVFKSREEFKNKLETLDRVHRNEIWNRFTPLFERLEKVQCQILELQNISDSYSHHTSIATSLNGMKALLSKIQPMYSSNLTIQSLIKTAEEVTKSLGVDSPFSVPLQKIIRETSQLSLSVVKEQKALNALYALYPSNGDGLLHQLRAYQKGNAPRGFRLRDQMNAIAKVLDSFSSNEKQELARIIGTGSNIEEKWSQLDLVFQRISANHQQIKMQDADSLEKKLNEAKGLLDNIKRQDIEKIQKLTGDISSEFKTLKENASKISLSLSLPISAGIRDSFTFSMPLIGTYFGLPIPSSLAGGAAFRFLQSSKTDDGFLQSTAKVAATVGATALSSWYMPNWVSIPGKIIILVPGFLSGACGVDKILTGLENHAFNKVWNIFTRAHKLSLNPRVYKAATTRAIQAISQR